MLNTKSIQLTVYIELMNNIFAVYIYVCVCIFVEYNSSYQKGIVIISIIVILITNNWWGNKTNYGSKEKD